MNQQQIAKIGVEIWGDRGWQTRMAEALGVDGSTVRRWVSGALPVPNPAAVALNCLLERSRSNSQVAPKQ